MPGRTTSAHTPPHRKSDEATREGLRLAKEAGDAYRRMVEYFIENVATSGQKKKAGEYTIGFTVEEAEPLYYVMGGELRLALPQDENAHLEVVVMDGADGRFIPGLTVHVMLTDESGEDVGKWELPFLWHPTMYHYGRSISLRSGGKYSARVYVETPLFPRHDEVNGKRYEMHSAGCIGSQLRFSALLPLDQPPNGHRDQILMRHVG